MQSFRSEIVKYSFVLLSTVLCKVYAQNCLSSGIFFNNQSEIDNFSTNYPSCTTIQGNVSFVSNDSGITNVDGLSQIENIVGDLSFPGMTDLMNIDGLSNLKTIGGSLSIEAVPNIVNLDGLSSLTSIGGDLILIGSFDNLDLLEDISGLSNLISIGENIDVNNYERLKSLDGLQNATTITVGILDLFNNSVLNDISALSDYDNIIEIFVQQNPMLSNCALQTFCERGNTLTHTIQNNAMGCNSFQEVAAQCQTLGLSDTFNLVNNADVAFYPNPVIDEITLIGIDSINATIYDLKGSLILNRINILDGKIDLSSLNRGFYFIHIEGINNIQQFYKL